MEKPSADAPHADDPFSPSQGPMHGVTNSGGWRVHIRMNFRVKHEG